MPEIQQTREPEPTVNPFAGRLCQAAIDLYSEPKNELSIPETTACVANAGSVAGVKIGIESGEGQKVQQSLHDLGDNMAGRDIRIMEPTMQTLVQHLK